jgi:hypothetical protein
VTCPNICIKTEDADLPLWTEAEVPGGRTISSFGFERIRLQPADGGEKRLGLRNVEAGGAKVWPTQVC